MTKTILLLLLITLVGVGHADIIGLNEPTPEPTPEPISSMLMLDLSTPEPEPYQLFETQKSVSTPSLLGLNSVSLKFETFNTSSGTITEVGSAGQSITFLTLYSVNFYVAVDYSGNVFEYILSNGVVTEQSTTHTVSTLNPNKVNRELQQYYSGIDIYEGVKTFKGSVDMVLHETSIYRVNSSGLYDDNGFVSSWGENITGLSHVIPEPTVGVLVMLFGVGLIVLNRLFK